MIEQGYSTCPSEPKRISGLPSIQEDLAFDNACYLNLIVAGD
jgi:hypothetical protein